MPHVAIVILNWNQRHDTLECLESLKRITYPSHRVIVVDNGSSDDSVNALRSGFPEVVVLAEMANHGCSGGRNLGARRALHDGADFVLFLDNDTIADPTFLEQMIETAAASAHIGIVGPAICYYDERDTVWTAGATVNRASGTTHPLHAGSRYSALPASPFGVDFVAGCALLAKREVFQTIGYFDDDYFIYFEEADWCYRAQRAGFGALVEPRARIWHKESQSLGGRHSPRKIYYMARNQLLFVSKRFPAPRRHVILGRQMISQIRIVALQYLLPRYSAQKNERRARVRALWDFAMKHYGKLTLGSLG